MGQQRNGSATLTREGCQVIRDGETIRGKQGLTYQAAISAESVGANAIHMQLLTIPPSGKGNAHKHAGHESAIYVVSGAAGVWYGDRLENHLMTEAGDFVYIAADVPHFPYNPSKTKDCVAIISRTDPNEQESVVLLPELDSIHG